MTNVPQDVELMARFLGRDELSIRRLLKAFARDSEIRDTVRAVLKRRCTQKGFDPDDPPVFWPVRELPPGTISLGRVIHGSTLGPAFTVPESVITQHLGLFGHNGTGKSFLAMDLALQAMRAGLKVWIFDIEDEYSRLVSALPEGTLLSVEPQQLRLNIFQPPGPWILPSSWFDELNLLLRGATFLRDGSLNVFHLGMGRLLERKAAATEGSDWPSFAEVVEYFRGLGFGPKSRTAGFLESLLNRLVTLSETFGQTARVADSEMLGCLSQRSVIFRLHGLTGIPLQFLASFLLLWLARFREGASDSAPHIVIIEEAHMLASEKARQDIGENVLCRMFRTARKRGIALVLCDQVPSQLPPAILGNLACRIVMRIINSQCIWSVQNSMGLDRKQAEAIAAMEPRQAVAQYTLYPYPFMIKVPEITLPQRPQETELTQQAERLLTKVSWKESSGAGERTAASSAKILAPDDLGGDVLLVMVRICQEPAEPIEQRCRALQMDRAREFRARAELDGRGLINQVKQTIGGKIKFFEPTGKGLEWAQKRNIRVKKFKSGIVHEYLLCQVERRIGLIGPKWRLQRNSSVARDQGLQPDLLVLCPDDKRIIVEICCSNLDYDAKNILIESQIPEIDKVVAIAPDKRTTKSLEQVLSGNCADADTAWQESITTLDAPQCLADDFDWSGTLVGGGPGLFAEK